MGEWEDCADKAAKMQLFVALHDVENPLKQGVSQRAFSAHGL
jgi:hypothetical protein